MILLSQRYSHDLYKTCKGGGAAGDYVSASKKLMGIRFRAFRSTGTADVRAGRLLGVATI
jgi:hypothetical protein